MTLKKRSEWNCIDWLLITSKHFEVRSFVASSSIFQIRYICKLPKIIGPMISSARIRRPWGRIFWTIGIWSKLPELIKSSAREVERTSTILAIMSGAIVDFIKVIIGTKAKMARLYHLYFFIYLKKIVQTPSYCGLIFRSLLDFAHTILSIYFRHFKFNADLIIE